MNDWTTDGLGMIGQPGQRLYEMTMVTGLALALLVGLQIALALYARRGVGGARIDARRVHRLLGRVLLGLVIAHALFYVSAVTWRIGHFAPAKLYHAFTDGSYYGNSLLMGLTGVGAVVAFGAAAALRRRVPWWHGLVRVGVLLGGWHAVRIGSHVREGAIGLALRVGLVVVAFEGAYRLTLAVKRRYGRGGPARNTARPRLVAQPAPGQDLAEGHVDMV